MASLLNWLQGAAAQVNPFDNGADFASVQRQKQEEERRRRQQQTQQRPTLQMGQAQRPNLAMGRPAQPQAKPLSVRPQAQAPRLAMNRPSATAFQNSPERQRMEQLFRKGTSYEDISKIAGFSDREVRDYAGKYHQNYGDQGPVGNITRGVGQFVDTAARNAAGIVAKPINDIRVETDANFKAQQEQRIQDINRRFQAGNMSGEGAMEQAQKIGNQFTNKSAYQRPDGQIAIKRGNVQEFGGRFAQQGIDTASVLPVAGGITQGASQVARAAGRPVLQAGLARTANTLSAGTRSQASSRLADELASIGINKNTANVVGNAITSNAKQAGVYGTAQTSADVAQGRGITPESLALNYGADFAMGALPEIAIGSAAPAIVKGGRAATDATMYAGIKRPTTLTDTELNVATKVRQAQEGMISRNEVTPEEMVVYNGIQKKLGAQPGTPDAEMAVVNALGAHRNFDVQKQMREQTVLDGLEKSSTMARRLVPGGTLDAPLSASRKATSDGSDASQVANASTSATPMEPGRMTPEAASPAESSPTTARTPEKAGSQSEAQRNSPYKDDYTTNNLERLDDGTSQFIREEAARYSSLDDLVEELAGDLYKNSRGGQGSSIVGTDDLGRGGFRVSENAPFYQAVAEELGKKPSKADINNVVRDFLDGKDNAAKWELPSEVRDIADAVRQASDERARTFDRLSEADQAAYKAKYPNGALPISDVRKIKVTQSKGTEKNLPVREIIEDGDVVTAKNVNPNVKVSEKRFSVDEEGKLIEDKKGATSLFTDAEGKVKGFRVGKEYFSAKDLGDLSTVNGYGSTVATMRRNVERAFDKPTGDKVSQFLVDHQQAQATKLIDRQLKLKSEMKSIADDLGINFASGTRKAKKVSAAIQDFGEGKKNLDQLVDEFGPQQATKIVNADKWFRKNYDQLLDEMNTTLSQFGYDPVPKRKNYYTHFQDESLWKQFGLKMQEIRDLSSPTLQDANPAAGRGSISNKLAGMSENTVPNKAFNRFALQRKGDARTADAFKAFELYLNPTLNNIYMTPSISRARVLARAIAQDADIMGKDANKTIVQIREWANSLSGKSNRIGDRFLADTTYGPSALKALNWAQRATGQNTIVGNLSTAVMQPIVLAQTAGKFGYKNTMAGLYQEANGSLAKAQTQSGFLRRRYANATPITAGKTDVVRNVANEPLRFVEEHAARATWNAAYNDALGRGLKGEVAIRDADINAEKTLAGRSIGERPEAFRSKTAGLATMFQLEVNNFWQQTGKEMSKAQIARTMVTMYGLNLLLQEVTGRQVGFNPIDAAIDTYDETQKDRPIEEKAKRIGQRWAGEVVDNAPFVGMAVNTMFGEKAVKDFTGDESNAGRFGVASPIRTLIDNPWMALSPAAGSQIKKTSEAVPVLMEGKLKDKDGKTLVDVPQTPENIAKGLAFGKGAIPEINQYYNNLGKDKIDQNAVQNQKTSKAANQSLEGLTKKQQEMLATAPADRQPSLRREYIEKNQADYKAKKAGSKITPTEEDKKTSSDKAAQTRVESNLNKNTSANSKHLLKKFAKTEDREKWFAEKPNAEFEYYKAKYENDKANGEISDIEDVKRKRMLYKDEVGSKYQKNTRDLYSLSKADIASYLATAKDGEKLAEELFKYDRDLYDMGINKYLKFKTGIGSTKKVAKGRKASGKKGGRKGGGRADSGITAGKALTSLIASTNRIKQPRATGGSAPSTSPQMKRMALKKYTVSQSKVSSKPVPIRTKRG